MHNVHISKRTWNRGDMQAIPGYKTENELVTPGSGPTGGPGDACISGQPEHRTAPGKQNIEPRRMRKSYVQPVLHMKERNCAVKPSSCADFNDPICSHTTVVCVCARAWVRACVRACVCALFASHIFSGGLRRPPDCTNV